MILKALVAAAALACTIATMGAATASNDMRNAMIGRYAHFGANKFNLRLDKIERVEHIDGNVIARDQNPNDPTMGYVILTLSVQNVDDPGNNPNVYLTTIFDDESQMNGHVSGPFVGKGRSDAPRSLETRQTVHERLVQLNVPVDRKVTKIILDPGDGGAKLRYAIRDSDIRMLPEQPAASPAS